jgi:proliferating cell nuclear antigen PCNA
MKISVIGENKKIFIHIFQMIKMNTNLIHLKFYETYLHIQGMDNCHVSLHDISLFQTWFDLYEKSDNDEICIDANIFSQILSFGLNDTEKITILFGEENIDISLIGTNYNKEFTIPQIENDYPWMNIPSDTEYDAEFSIKTKLGQDFCNQLMIFGDTMKINCNENNIYFSTSGTNGDMKVEIKSENLIDYAITEGEQIDIEYSINYIQKVFFLAKTFDIIYFSISKSLPLKLSFHLDYDSSKLEFYIAPKIED